MRCYIGFMTDRRVERIGIRELRQNASVYIDRVWREGVTVEITNRGHLAARIVPVEQPEDPLADLVAAGLVEPLEEGDESLDLLDIVPLPLPPGAPLPSEDIIRERHEAPR
jgi:prevent-host-death family protein